MSATLVGITTLHTVSTEPNRFRPGEIVTAWSSTLGPVSAMYCRFVKAVSVVGSPMYPIPASFNAEGGFAVTDDEDGQGVIGQEACLGPCLASAPTTGPCYGFVQLSGRTLVQLRTDDSVEAGEILFPSAADGVWSAYPATKTVNEGGNAQYTLRLDAGLGVALAADAGSPPLLPVGGAQIDSRFRSSPTL